MGVKRGITMVIGVITVVVMTPITTMKQSRNQNNDHNDTETLSDGASSSRCSTAQRRPDRNQALARMRRSKKINIVVMECFYSVEQFDENGVPK